nr:LEAF RUST 10 DISEASE-RESISTANCE LOCUS RECEPTOR-LIKE PROTEIN KINASE-like 2.7 [Ziziphus jujuba var. spinosa]
MVHSPSCFLFLAFVFAAVTNLSTTTTALKFQRVTDEERFKECNQEFTCESTRSQLRFKYPFWGGGDEMSHCGLPGFKLTCRENYAVIEIMKENFTILEIKWDEQIVTVVRMDMLDDGCPDYEFINITVYNKTFECAPSNEKLTYSYGCSSSNISSRKVPQEKGFTCTPNETVPGLYTMETPHQTNKISCTNTTDIPVLPKYYRYLQSNKMAAKDVVKEGFDLRYKFDTKEACSECLRSGGQCGCNEVSKEFVCFYEDQYYLNCSLPARTCGDNQTIRFPFYLRDQQNPYCGYPGFEVSCDEDGHSILNLFVNDPYIVRHISYEKRSLIVSNAAISHNSTPNCIPPLQNISFPNERFKLPKQNQVFLLSDCSPPRVPEYEIGCSSENATNWILGVPENEKEQLGNLSKKCGDGKVVVMPVKDYDSSDDESVGMRQVLSRGFELTWKADDCSRCQNSGGVCGFNTSSYLFQCYCEDRPHRVRCQGQSSL